MATSVADGTTTNYTYNASNRLTAKGTRTFTYDNQGNEITDATKTLGYDYINLLKTYTSGSTNTSYKYDASGNRIEKNQTGTGATNYQYVNSGNSQVMVTKNITAGTSNFNVYGVDLVSQGDTATTARQYYLTDGLGNVRYLTNSSGTTLNSYAIDPYGGNATGTGTTANNFTYQAEQKDSESTLIYLRARYYDPSIGRFVSQDPLPGIQLNAQTQNGYNYANNNPTDYNDPLGLAAQCNQSVTAANANIRISGLPLMNDTSKSMIPTTTDTKFINTYNNIINAASNAYDAGQAGAKIGAGIGCAAGATAGAISGAVAGGAGAGPGAFAGCVAGTQIGTPVGAAAFGGYAFIRSVQNPSWQNPYSK